MRHINSEEIHMTHTAVALGKFEGVHLGHQLLIEEIIRQKMFDYTSVVFTFDRLPIEVLTNREHYNQLFTKKERSDILEEMGVDVLIEHPFTKEFASLSPEAFVRRILVGKMGVRLIVVGADFRFGRNRAGTVDTLRYLAEDCDYELVVKDKLKKDGEEISSTRIRSVLAEGHVEEAGALMGRPFTISGQVVHGKGLGRKLGVPSANISLTDDKFTPADGVYLTRAMISGKPVYGVTNIGFRPTVDSGKIRNVETHFLQYEGDLYGQEIRLAFLHYMRPETRFSSVEELKDQLLGDIAAGEKLMEKN